MVSFQQQFLNYEDAEQHQNAVNKALVGNEIFIQNVVIGDCNCHDIAIIDETPSLFKMMQ